MPVLHQTCRAVRDDKVIILDTFEDDITVGVRARLATGSIELVDEGLPLWVRRGELILEYVAIGQMPVGAAHAAQSSVQFQYALFHARLVPDVCERLVV